MAIKSVAHGVSAEKARVVAGICLVNYLITCIIIAIYAFTEQRLIAINARNDKPTKLGSWCVMTINPEIRNIAIAILVFFSDPQAIFATSVLQVDVDYLLNEAILIFEGDVLSSEAKWNHDKTNIATFVTFRVKDVIKGETQSATVTVMFSGGTVGETGLQVSEMVYPAVGENGIYFLENPGQQLVNPMVGWGQGHFRVMKDSNGMERILTEGGAPVLSLDVAVLSDMDGGNAGKPSISPFSHGVARGVRTGKRDDALSTAMNKKQFKDTLKARLAAMKSNSKYKHGSVGK